MKSKAKKMKRDYKKYGITSTQWDAMYNLQKGLCPICQHPIRRPGNKEGKRAAAVDHDHKSGRVRGLLHFRCNKYVVGRMDCEKVKRAETYLCSDFDARNL